LPLVIASSGSEAEVHSAKQSRRWCAGLASKLVLTRLDAPELAMRIQARSGLAMMRWE